MFFEDKYAVEFRRNLLQMNYHHLTEVVSRIP